MTRRDITVTVNGAAVSVGVEPRRRLVELLRDDLGLTGTKVSCEVQVCGACTVLVDGEPISACTYLAVDVDGRTVTTVEGLAPDGVPSAVQQAFVEAGAVQCGFCTPGLVLAVTALLDELPEATDEDVVEHLDGNLCRCTGYAPILAAVRLAQARRSEVGAGG